MLQIGRSLVRSQLVSLEFFIDIILPIALWAWGRLSQEDFLGGKGGRCVGLTTLPPSCAVVMYSGNLNFLESSGPLQACNGTALPLPLPDSFRGMLATFVSQCPALCWPDIDVRLQFLALSVTCSIHKYLSTSGA